MHRKEGNLQAEMLPGDFLQVMRLVYDQMLVWRKQPMLGTDIGEQHRMIRNDDIGQIRLLLGAVIIAASKPWAGTVKTGVGVARYRFPEIGASVAEMKLLLIAILGFSKPNNHLRGRNPVLGR